MIKAPIQSSIIIFIYVSFLWGNVVLTAYIQHLVHILIHYNHIRMFKEQSSTITKQIFVRNAFILSLIRFSCTYVINLLQTVGKKKFCKSCTNNILRHDKSVRQLIYDFTTSFSFCTCLLFKIVQLFKKEKFFIFGCFKKNLDFQKPLQFFL